MELSAPEPIAPCPAGVARHGRHRWEILRELWRCLDCGVEQAPRESAPSWVVARRGRPPRAKPTGGA